MGDEPRFRIQSWPERSFSRGGDLEYEGGTVFSVAPGEDDESIGDDFLRELVESVLDDGPYRYGDFLELPMPLYLVRDDETGDVFRVSIRDCCIRLHVLPETEPDGLRAFYGRLDSRRDVDWRVRSGSQS